MVTHADEENFPERYDQDDDNPERKPERTLSLLANEISMSDSESLQPLNMAIHPLNTGTCTCPRHRPVTKNSLKA